MENKLKRKIGLFGLTAYGVGMILGAGIYALIGKAAGEAGNSLWASFLIGAVISSFTGLSYAELSSSIPKAAAEYSYAKEIFGRNVVPFLVGWIIIFTGSVSASTVALGFAGYFSGIFNVPSLLVAFVLIVLLSVVNFAGIEESSKLNIVFTIIEAVGLVLIIFFGIPNFGKVNYLDAHNGMRGVLAATTLIFFSYLGFEDIANIAEEAKNPQKTLPKALILSIAITSVLYVLASISIVSLADWQILATSESPLAYALSQTLGQNAFLLMSVIALFATANTVLILLIVTSRMIYGMAVDKSLPYALAKISKRGTPYLPIVVAMVLSVLFTFAGDIRVVAEITNFGTFITFASVNFSAIWLRVKRPEWQRPFKTPISIGKIPLIPLLGLLSCGLLLTQFSPIIIAISIAIIILGIIVYMILSRKR